MKSDMRKRLRNLLTEIMADGQEHSLPELKDAIRQKTGLVYKQDYFESHWSGAIKDLRSDGRIRRLERGNYIWLRPEMSGENSENTSSIQAETADIDRTEKADNCVIAQVEISETEKEECDDNGYEKKRIDQPSSSPLTEISVEMRRRIQAHAVSLIQNDYSYLLQALSAVNLSASLEEDKEIEKLRRLWRLRDVLGALRDWL